MIEPNLFFKRIRGLNQQMLRAEGGMEINSREPSSANRTSRKPKHIEKPSTKDWNTDRSPKHVIIIVLNIAIYFQHPTSRLHHLMAL